VRAPAAPLGLALAALLTLAPAPAARAQDKEPGDASPSLRDVRWGLAPIRWRGLLTTDLRSFSADGELRRFQQVEAAQLSAASYVWQPWFAQVSAGIGGIVSSERGGTGGRSTALTGNGALSLFPASRFPFLANFDVSDSRASDQFVGQSYQTRRLGVRQSYRNVAGDAGYSASFDRSTLSSSSFGNDTLSVLTGSHNRTLGPHRFDLTGNVTRNAREGSGEHSALTRLFASHNYSADRLLTVNTFANYGTSDLRLGSLGSLGAPSEAQTEVFQVNSFFTWRREEGDPLYVTGGGRLFQSRSSLAAEAADSRQLTGFASAIYRMSRNLQLNASASATQSTSSAGGGDLLTTQSGGATYATDLHRLGEFLYSANLGANLANQTSRAGGARQLFTSQAGHNLQRLYDLGGAQSLSFGLSQSAGLAQDSRAGGTHTLSHGANLAYRVTRGDSLAAFVSSSASDSRSSGQTPSSFQLLNVQLSGQAQFGRHASALANLTVQGVRQETPSSPARGFNRTINGGVTYQHAQVFGVPRLRYLASYNRNDFQLNSRLQGDLDAPREQINQSFEQRLEYRVGRIEARLSFRLAEVDGKKNALIFFRLAREFGD
jgi:hypothetical protein